ncbi:hypothetical protein Drorol1_Dr00000601 [Drosera rotundifolia]
MPTRSLSLSSFPSSFVFLFPDFPRTLLFLFLFPLHLSFGLNSQTFWRSSARSGLFTIGFLGALDCVELLRVLVWFLEFKVRVEAIRWFRGQKRDEEEELRGVQVWTSGLLVVVCLLLGVVESLLLFVEKVGFRSLVL